MGLDNKDLKYKKMYLEMIHKKHLPKNHDVKKTVFISGHMDLSEKEFDTYYRKKIDEYCEQGFGFIIGGATGADELALKYILSKNSKIIVCLPDDEIDVLKKRIGEGIKNVSMISHFKNIKNEKDEKLVSKFQCRDIFMTNSSSIDLAFLRQYAGAGSASAENLYRRIFGIRKAEKIVKLIRDHSMKYDKKVAESTIEK